jgi:bacterioferritin-associated ferredoxin
MLKAVQGDQEVQSVVISKVDSKFNTIPGYTQTLDVDTVCIGYGLIPSIRLTSMIGCKHRYNPMLEEWVSYFDENMQTSQPGVFVAGDGAGIAGVLVARHEGTLAGLFAAAFAGIIPRDKAERAARPIHKKLSSLHKFRKAIDQMYRIHPALYANIPNDTVVCRCEDVTAGEIRKAIQNGASDLNSIKRLSRAGMGYCQGANCMPIVTAMLALEFNMKIENIEMMTNRPPTKPISLNLLGSS